MVLVQELAMVSSIIEKLTCMVTCCCLMELLNALHMLTSHHTHLLVVGEPLGVDEPETAAAAPCLAVRGLPLPALRPPLSLRLNSPLLGSELGVLRRAVPELLRRRSMSPAGDKPGDAALTSACTGHQSTSQSANPLRQGHTSNMSHL